MKYCMDSWILILNTIVLGLLESYSRTIKRFVEVVGVISVSITHPLNLWFVSPIEFFMAMSHSGLEMRSFLNPFSNWHTSAVVAIMLSLVSVDELPVPSDKRIQNPPCTGKKKPCQMLSNPHGMITPPPPFPCLN